MFRFGLSLGLGFRSSLSPLLLPNQLLPAPIPKPIHIPSSFSFQPITTTTTTMSAANPNPNATTSTDSDSDILHKFLFFNVYKDGRVTVFSPPLTLVPAVNDPTTGVQIKDVKINTDFSARIFLPPTPSPTAKLPVLLYAHGGGFCMQSAFSAEYTSYLTKLSAAANLVAVSVDYGLFPDRPIPACYDDTSAALNWIATLSDPWLSSHADLRRLFLAGDSAGANICHTVAARAKPHIEGIVLIHPYFGEDDKMWMYMCPNNEGPQDRRMKPAAEDLARIPCGRVLVFIGEKDVLRDAGKGYVDELIKSGWKGTVEIVENKGKDHCFHLIDPSDDEASVIQDKIISFINHNINN